MRRRAPRWILAAVIALLVALSAPAHAQVPPLPLPPLPPEAGPVLELVAPLVSPQCGNAALALALLPGLVATAGIDALPFDISPLTSPIVVLCASVPVPESSTQLVCAVDDQALGAASAVTFLVLGTAPPVATRVVGPLAEIAVLVERALPAPANSAGVADNLRTALACRPVDDPPPLPRPVVSAPVPPAVAEIPAATEDVFARPALGSAGGFPPSAPPERQTFPAASVATPETGHVLPVSTRLVGFAYPAVLVLPLLLLALGGYLARSLTAEVRLPKP